MSRELIAANIVTTLKTIIDNGRPKFVTREPFDFEKLSNAQYPAVLVQTGTETRSDATLGADDGSREGVIDYTVICYIKSGTIDTARNNLVTLLENALEADRTRGGYAKDTQVVSVQTDEGSIHPIGGVILTVRVLYSYIRGNA